ncbi:hypothetical protein ABZ069_37635, partial [Streptomyces microflavus]
MRPGPARFSGSNFSGGRVDCNEVTFSGGRVDFSGATFSGGRVPAATALRGALELVAVVAQARTRRPWAARERL